MPYDVCVFGGTAGGVIAAVSAARLGRSVVLASEGPRLGGMVSGGLGATDVGRNEIVGGITREFYERTWRIYGVREPLWRITPGVATRVFADMVREAGVTVLAGVRILRAEKKAARLVRVSADRGVTLEARMFIDASYEGDLLAAAGVGYSVGREASAQYGEPLNGIRGARKDSQFAPGVDPFVKPGNPGSGLLPCIQEGDGGPAGEGDRRVQAYNFRLCLTDVAANRIPVPPPEAYDPARYELLARQISMLRDSGQAVKFTDFFLIVRLPDGKTDFNNTGPFSSDHVGASWEYPDGGPEVRERIRRDHVEYTRGLFHFIRTDPRVPPEARRGAEMWGLCRDEFTETGGWSPQLYVREARRMVGSMVLTQADCERKKPVTDSVGMAAFTIDSHICQRVVREGKLENEGNIGADVLPYPVSYGTLLPRQKECENLLVPVCLSASHVSYGSLRMEPVFMVLGQSAGFAASQAIAEGKSVQEIRIPVLQSALQSTGQVLDISVAGMKTEEWWHSWPHQPHVIKD